MKYFTISFPGEYGQHVEEIWNEDQIIQSYYPYWKSKMMEALKRTEKHTEISKENCIRDWCIIYWAIEVEKPDWITE